MGFGARLRTLREQAGLSQGGLAERAGVSLDSIQNWEQGRTRPRLEFLPKLARGLGVTTDALILAEANETEAPKRPRGRPRKDVQPVAEPRKPRGRPRKRA